MTEKEMFINIIEKFTEHPLGRNTEKNTFIIASDNGDEIEFAFDDSGKILYVSTNF